MGDNVENNALWRVANWYPDLAGTSLEKLKIYHSELLKFNLKLNLVSRNTERDADEDHFSDCIQACRLIVGAGLSGPVYDIGSGNGLPGAVMAILAPQTQLKLVESDSRKAEFLKHLVFTLDLKNCSVMNVRLETLKGENIQAGVSRGFANLSKSVLTVNRCFAVGGRYFHMKGSNWSMEVGDMPSQLVSVWKPELLGEYSLPVSQARRSVVLTTKVRE